MARRFHKFIRKTFRRKAIRKTRVPRRPNK